MHAEQILQHLHDAASAVRTALQGLDDWGHLGAAGAHSGQHRSDVVADRAMLDVLLPTGMGVLSEETGLHRAGPITVVADPVDGSTNAARGIPHWATSLAAVDGDGVVVALVVNQATGECFTALRGGGAFLDDTAIAPTSATTLSDSVFGVNGHTGHHTDFGSRQYRAFGAGALDLSYVACGRLDAYADITEGQHGPWDYLAALLVCEEAGAVTAEVEGRGLLTLDHAARRGPAAAATPELLAEVLTARAVARDAGTLPDTSV